MHTSKGSTMPCSLAHLANPVAIQPASRRFRCDAQQQGSQKKERVGQPRARPVLCVLCCSSWRQFACVAQRPAVPISRIARIESRNKLWMGATDSNGSRAGWTEEHAQQLKMAMARVQALEEYQCMLSSATSNIDVLRCAILIAKHAYPLLSEEQVLRTIDNLAEDVRGHLPTDPTPNKVLRSINEVLYSSYGFHGNQEDYYDRDNSCINRVLERRTGIPITLALVYTEVAKRVGLPMSGVDLPSHFMIKPEVDSFDILIDAFNKGMLCHVDAVEQELSQKVGKRVNVESSVVRSQDALYPRMFLCRMLNNLKNIYLSANDAENVLWIVRYLKATRPSDLGEVRDEGLVLYALHRYEEAAAELEHYLRRAHEANDAAMVQAIVHRIRQQQRHKRGGSGGYGWWM